MRMLNLSLDLKHDPIWFCIR